jgi:hypothetical protein
MIGVATTGPFIGRMPDYPYMHYFSRPVFYYHKSVKLAEVNIGGCAGYIGSPSLDVLIILHSPVQWFLDDSSSLIYYKLQIG